MKKMLGFIAGLLLISGAKADPVAHIYLHDSTTCGLKAIVAGITTNPQGVTIGQTLDLGLNQAKGGPLASTGQIVDQAYPYPQGGNCPSGSLAWAPTFDAAGDYEFDIFAGGMPYSVYTQHYCIRLVVDGNDLGTKCTNPDSNWDPAIYKVPFGDGSSAQIYFTTAPSMTQS